MQCPCGQSELSSRDFRAFLASNREALMAARVVTKGEKFGGAVMRKNADGSMYVGPDRGEEEDDEAGEPRND
jgi:hypothetical protein